MQTEAHGKRHHNESRARALGYFSLALGLSELVAPSQVARLIGVRDKPGARTVLRLFGAREMLSGLSILASRDGAGPLWSRVAGDCMDLALLGWCSSRAAENPSRLAAATAAVAGITVLDAYSAASLSRNESIQKAVGPIHVVRSIAINRSPADVYQFWRSLENLPRFMAHLESVTDEGTSSVWRAKAPAGATIEWRAEITQDQPNERIAWRSVDGALVENRGAVCFKSDPHGRGTVVVVELKYDPPGGALSSWIAKLFGEEPGQQIAGDLRRLKQVLETGGVVHSDASIHRGLHAARPAAANESITLLGEAP